LRGGNGGIFMVGFGRPLASLYTTDKPYCH